MFAGSVSIALPACDAPGASSGTARLPSSTSVASSDEFVDRKNRVVEAPARPPPWFAVVSDTLNVEPAAGVAGVVSTDTTRSGPDLDHRGWL